MNTDSILDGLQKPTWTYGNQDDWDKLTADNATLRELLGEVKEIALTLGRVSAHHQLCLSRQGVDCSCGLSGILNQLHTLHFRVQQKLEEK